MVVRINPNLTVQVLTQQKHQIRLGEGGFAENRLTPEAMERARVVIGKFIEIAHNFKVIDIIAVATSATRDAVNGEELVRQIHDDTGVYIPVISGEEEARLIWRGISSGTHIQEETALFIDIGGGSTEVIVADESEPLLIRSLKLGAIRTTNRFLTPSITGPVPGEILEEMQQFIRLRIAHTARHIQKHTPGITYGSSGTILTLESIAALNPGLIRDHTEGLLTRGELETILTHLCSLSLEERRKIPGLNPERADIIPAGALILLTILSSSGIAAIRTTPLSLRDGLLADFLAKIPGFPSETEIPVRTRSVRNLARLCQINEKHADQVRRLALSLFDSGKAVGIHTISDDYRELLAYAACLHDTGQFISYPGHHQHSYYLITSVPLLGFTRHETEIMGLICRYHRKKVPKNRDLPVIPLEEEELEIVMVLSLLLRIAENLDRSHDGRVSDVWFSGQDEKTITLAISCTNDCLLERWAILDDRKTFERITGKEIRIDG